MMDTRHFHNFKPCTAVQWPTEAEAASWKASQWDSREADLANLARGADPSPLVDAAIGYMLGRTMRHGQWLIRQGPRLWAQDEEPARVERWETLGAPVTQSGVMGARRSVEDCIELVRVNKGRGSDYWGTGDYDPWRTYVEYRRPIVVAADGERWTMAEWQGGDRA